MSRNAESFEGTSTLQETDREQPGGGKAVWRMQGKTSPELCQGYCFYSQMFGAGVKTEEMMPYPALRDQ